MYATEVAIIGGGQAGLAMRRCLVDLGIDHIVFERGEIGGRWQSHTWDSLRLLTPNWMNVLPKGPYDGDDPDGFMHRDAFTARLRNYAAACSAPVMTHTEVVSVVPDCTGFLVTTARGMWRARAVVIATGQCDLPQIPGAAPAIDPRVANLHSSQYRSPAAIPDGGVLVVGASSSGVQIADELRRCGRAVTVAVGRHTRLPRNWRGRDIFWWLDRMGVLAERTRDLADADGARRQPSLQLAGRLDRSNVDLATLQRIGVRLTGRLVAAEGDTIAFADNLAASVQAAEVKQRRLLAQIDTFAGLEPNTSPSEIEPIDLSLRAPRGLSLKGEGISTIVWATGYRRSFAWLKVPVVGSDGEILHRDGVTAVPGLYALGFRLLRKRDSNLIGGVGSDALVLSQRIASFLGRGRQRAA